MRSQAFTLISAAMSDQVPGAELAAAEARYGRQIVNKITDLRKVRDFFEEVGYGPDNPDELIYLIDEEWSNEGWPTLTVWVDVPQGPALVNLTPHPIRLVGPTETVELAPAGTPARVEFEPDQPDGWVEVSYELIVPVVRTALTSRVTGLPQPRQDTLLVVSRQVVEACPDRVDLVFPHRTVRDDNGKITGCQALARPAKPRDAGENATDSAKLLDAALPEHTHWYQALPDVPAPGGGTDDWEAVDSKVMRAMVGGESRVGLADLRDAYTAGEAVYVELPGGSKSWDEKAPCGDEESYGCYSKQQYSRAVSLYDQYSEFLVRHADGDYDSWEEAIMVPVGISIPTELYQAIVANATAVPPGDCG